MYIDLLLLFFSSPALFEKPRGDRNYCLCTVRRSGKGIQTQKKGLRFIHAEGKSYCSGLERLDNLHQLLCMNGWLNYNTYDIPW